MMETKGVIRNGLRKYIVATFGFAYEQLIYYHNELTKCLRELVKTTYDTSIISLLG